MIIAASAAIAGRKHQQYGYVLSAEHHSIRLRARQHWYADFHATADMRRQHYCTLYRVTATALRFLCKFPNN